ncbi:MAG: hypothetical protein RSB70_05165 [Clostridium sp.]
MNREKYITAKDSISKTLTSLESILNEDSPTGLNDGVSYENLDFLISELDRLSTLLESYSK